MNTSEKPKVKKQRKLSYDELHLGCYSYPNCDEGPRGCVILYGKDAEQYGNRD